MIDSVFVRKKIVWARFIIENNCCCNYSTINRMFFKIDARLAETIRWKNGDVMKWALTKLLKSAVANREQFSLLHTIILFLVFSQNFCDR